MAGLPSVIGEIIEPVVAFLSHIFNKTIIVIIIFLESIGSIIGVLSKIDSEGGISTNSTSHAASAAPSAFVSGGEKPILFLKSLSFLFLSLSFLSYKKYYFPSY